MIYTAQRRTVMALKFYSACATACTGCVAIPLAQEEIDTAQKAQQTHPDPSTRYLAAEILANEVVKVMCIPRGASIWLRIT